MAVLPLKGNVMGWLRIEVSAVGSDSTRRWARGSDVLWGPSGLDGMGGWVVVAVLSYSIVALMKTWSKRGPE